MTNRRGALLVRRLSIMAVVLVALIGRAEIFMFAEAGPQALNVTASFADGKAIARSEVIEFRLSRALSPSEGRIAVLIGNMDVSALLVVSDNTLVYTPRILPLPDGDHTVILYLVSPNNTWKQIAQFSLRVETASAIGENRTQSNESAPAQSQAQAKANGHRWGFDKAAWTPSLTIGLKSQAAESHFPDFSRPARPTFADVTLQGTIRTEMARAGFNSQSQFDIAGSSFGREALRFAEKGDAAPRIDLASYLLQFQVGKARLQVGHVAFGSNRLLINSFSSRGITINLPVTSRSDFSIAAMNGTSIVGWDNFFGLDRRKHQVISATFGYEFFPQRPGGLRVESAIMHGSLLPFSNFNQGVINDAEQSKGLSFRIVASDSAGRFHLDSGFARSRFNNPSDPLLEQGLNTVAVRETSRNARYLDASYNILQNIALSETKRASLAFNFRHERVDPLFRSVAAFTQADRSQNQFELVGSIAGINATFVHDRFNDNLDDIPSILKSITRRNGFILGVPLVSLVGDQGNPSPWLPRLSYTFDRVHQFGLAFPINSGFDSVSQVPDQISDNQVFASEWQAKKWRFGYRLNRSFQDNRQAGRELADLDNLINGFTFGFIPTASFDLNLDLARESANNREQNRTDHTNRISVNINWSLTRKMALAATVSTTFAGDEGEISRSRSAEFDFQWSYRFGQEKSRYRKFSAQTFIRYANRYASSRDILFGFNNLTKIQTLNTGLSFTFF